MGKEKVVAASGYFDPLHVGHLDYLERARDLGDKLIVIVNNDHQAIERKGRPFMSAAERIKILGALKFVDEVFEAIDKDSTVTESLKKVKPDIFANGGDMTVEDTPEKEVCDAIGCKIITGLGKQLYSSAGVIIKFPKKDPDTPKEMFHQLEKIGVVFLDEESENESGWKNYSWKLTEKGELLIEKDSLLKKYWEEKILHNFYARIKEII